LHALHMRKKLGEPEIRKRARAPELKDRHRRSCGSLSLPPM